MYRGCLMPGLAGTYFYGDLCAGFIRSVEVAGGAAVDPRDWTAQIDPGATLQGSMTSFGVDAQGEIYVTNRGGTVLRIMPPFTDLEVAGRGAADPLLLAPAAWTWEDLAISTMHPVSLYRVYRGTPGGGFQCIFTTTTPGWAGGDPAIPAVGAVFGYVVTAVSPDGEETLSGSPPVNLLPAACP